MRALLAAVLAPITATAQIAIPAKTTGAVAGVAAAQQQPPLGCEAAGHAIGMPGGSTSSASGFPPVQLEVRTPFEPTVIPSGGRDYLMYELHLRNLGSDVLDLQGIEVIGAQGTGKPVAAFGADQLPALFRPRGHGMSADEAASSRHLAGGQGVVAYLCLAFDRGVPVPAKLRHRVLLKGASAEGPVIGTGHTRLRALSPPVAGANWIAAGGPGNTSHHRVGLLVIDGKATISRRYAIDWKQIENGATFAGDPIHAGSYHAYGEPVYAVADGTVVDARDGFPDNVPRTTKGFDTAVPITMESVAGNAVVLDLGDGQYAFYAHLQPGSVLVKKGDRVRRGQPMARIGNSGDSREPHLHFDVTDNATLFVGEGLPYVIDGYQARSGDGTLDARTKELPLLEARVDFEAARLTSD